MLAADGLEARKNLAIRYWKNQKHSEMELYQCYLFNSNIKDSSEFSLEEFRQMRKDYASKHPNNPSLSNGIGLIDKVYYETLYQGNPERAQTTLKNRATGEWMAYLLLFASVFSASFGPTIGAALILVIFSPALLIGSGLYLFRSAYDYINTPKSERTPLQKFNFLSSIPSTILVGLFVNAAMNSLFFPAAFLITLAVGAAWFGYKIWQTNKGSSIKWAKYKAIENELESTNQQLESLKKQEPEIQNEIERLQALDKLAKLRSSPTYVNQRTMERDLEDKLTKLDGRSTSSSLIPYSIFSQGASDEEQNEDLYMAGPREPRR